MQTAETTPAGSPPSGSLRTVVTVNFVLAALISAAAGLRSIGPVLAGELSNPDSYMRLVRLRDELAVGHTLYAVARDGSGHGTVLHWSHLLDSLLALLTAPFGLFANTDTALLWSGIFVGPLSMGALGAALGWAMAPLAERRFLWSAAASCALAPPILGYGRIGVVHHHVLLLVVAAMAAGWAVRLAVGRGGMAAGIALGAWAGLGIWLSPETMPFILMAFGGTAWAWLLAPSTPGLRSGMAASGTTLLLVTLAAVLADPPSGGYFAVEIDRISGVTVALGAACCAAGWAMALLARPAGAALALLGLLAWLAAFPAVLHGTDGIMTPEQTRIMFDHIVEMAPVTGLADLLRWLTGGVLGLALLVLLAWRRRSLLLAYVTLCGAVALELGFMHVRFAAYSAALAAAMLPVALTLATRALAGRDERLLALARTGVLALPLLLPGLAPLVPSEAQATPADSAEACDLRQAASMLAPYAGRIVLAEPNDTPELLYRAPVLTVGSIYQRNPEAFLRLRAAWRSQSRDAPDAAVTATGAQLVLVCRRPTRSSILLGLPRDTLLDRLSTGEVPPWLRQAASEPTGYVLYERLR